MASARATTLAQAFSNKLLKEMYEMSLVDKIVNRDYEGEVNGVGSKINILNIARISEKNYTGSNLTADSLYETNTVLTLDQQKSFYWTEKTIDNWKSYIKDPHSTVVSQKADERNKNMDEFVLGLYGDVGAGNRVGTDYTDGTVTIDASGNVTGDGTTFTSAMVGKGFKATGHTKWYRVKSRSSNTAIVIENDSDDEASSYDGGVISSGSTYKIEANTAVSVTTSNLLQKVADLKQKLDETEKYGLNAVPDRDRWLIAPPEFFNILVRASGVVLHVDEAYRELVTAGFKGELLGFKLFQSSRLSGDNTSGYHILAGHPNWMTFAEKLLEADIEEDLIGNFGSAYKDLFVYGAKVADSRRHFAAELFATFA
jgi:hypothetical protein